MVDVHGGAGGSSAELEDLRLKATLLDLTGDGLHSAGDRVTGLGDTALLLSTAAFGPGSAARAQGALVGSTVRLLALGGRCELQADVLRLVAGATEAADVFVMTATDVFRHIAGPVVLAEMAVESLMQVPVGIARGTADHALEKIPFLDRTPEDPEFWDSVRGGVADQLSEYWTPRLSAAPELYHLALSGVETVASLGGFLSDPLDFEAIDRYDIARALLEHISASGGADTPISVRALPDESLPYGDKITVPDRIGFNSLSSFISQLEDVEAQARHDNVADDDAYSLLSVIEVDGRYVVQVPGTQEWSHGPGGDPSDTSTNLAGFANGDAAAVTALADALAQAGVPHDAPILISGHSQGGIIASAFAVASDDLGYNVTHVVTAGSPVSHFDFPDDIQVMSFEHSDDPVPNLNDPNRDRPNHTTVTTNAPAPFAQGPGGPHDRVLYVQTAAVAERENHPSVATFIDGADDFFGQGDAQWFHTSREG